MGELLEIASWVGTPRGGICAVAFVAACFFYGRWVLTDKKPVSKTDKPVSK
jgi:hypothetical protein